MTRFRLVCVFLLLLIACCNARNQGEPNSAEGYYRRGLDYRVNHDYDKAIKDFTEAIRLNPKYAAAYYDRGCAYRAKQEYDKAIQDHTEAIRLNPNDAYAYLNRGFDFEQKQEYEKAIQDFTEAIRLDPMFADAYCNRGDTYTKKKEFDKAIADHTEAIRLHPRYTTAYICRGAAYFFKKEYDKAVEDYSEVIRFNPNDAEAHLSLAWLLATCPKNGFRDGKQAVQHAMKACELLDWKDARCLTCLAAANAESGEFKEAVKWQKKALDLGFSDREKEKKAQEQLKLYEAGKPYRAE